MKHTKSITRRKLLTTIVLLLIAGCMFTSASTANAGDPFVGKWQWSDGSIVKIFEDGTGLVTDGRRPRATWSCSNTKPPRKYELRWGNKWIDTITLFALRNELKGINQDGFEFSAHRIP